MVSSWGTPDDAVPRRKDGIFPSDKSGRNRKKDTEVLMLSGEDEDTYFRFNQEIPALEGIFRLKYRYPLSLLSFSWTNRQDMDFMKSNQLPASESPNRILER